MGSESDHDTVSDRIEGKAEKGQAKELQFNSTPPLKEFRDSHDITHRCFYTICSYSNQNVIKSLCLVDGYYFNANSRLPKEMLEFIRKSISEGLEKLEDKEWISHLISLTEKELPMPKPKKK